MAIKRNFLQMLFSINFLIILASGFMTPVWAEFVRHIGGDLRTAGNAVCIFSIMLGVFTWIAAHYENKMNCNPLIVVVSQLLFVISYAGYFFVNHPFQLYMVQMALGISGAIQVPALFSLFQRLIPENKSTFYWGLWNGFFDIALGSGALISAYTVERFGFKAMFILLLSVAVVCFLATLYFFMTQKWLDTKQ